MITARRSTHLMLIALAVALAACSDSTTEPTSKQLLVPGSCSDCRTPSIPPRRPMPPADTTR